jgi:hypothetical protein
MDKRHGNLIRQFLPFEHGPQDLFERYFTDVEDLLFERGLQIAVSFDFEKLVRVNSEHRASWPPLLPFSNPAFNRLDRENAFWLDVQDHRGDTVMTHCGRLFEWSGTTLEQEIKSLRLFYMQPMPHAAAGEVIEIVDAPSASQISGRVLLTSAAWVHPDLRRHGLTKIVPRVSRAYAYARWRTSYTICFVEPKFHAVGVTRAYGDYHVEEGVIFPLRGRGKVQYMLLWMTTDTMVREIVGLVRGRQNRSVAQQRRAEDEAVTAPAMPG